MNNNCCWNPRHSFREHINVNKCFQWDPGVDSVTKMMKDAPEIGCREMQVNLFGDAISCAARTFFCHLLAVGLLVETFVEQHASQHICAHQYFKPGWQTFAMCFVFVFCVLDYNEVLSNQQEQRRSKSIQLKWSWSKMTPGDRRCLKQKNCGLMHQEELSSWKCHALWASIIVFSCSCCFLARTCCLSPILWGTCLHLSALHQGLVRLARLVNANT